MATYHLWVHHNLDYTPRITSIRKFALFFLKKKKTTIATAAVWRAILSCNILDLIVQLWVFLIVVLARGVCVKSPLVRIPTLLRG